MKDCIVFDFPFKKYEMGRLDEIINEQISSLGFKRGVVKIIVPEGVVITTIEYEENLVDDFKLVYQNFESKMKNKLSSSMSPFVPGQSLTLPFNLGRLVVGDWQQIVFFTVKKLKSIKIEIEVHHSDNILGLESITTTAEFQTIDITDIIERTLVNSTGEYITMISPDSTVGLFTVNPLQYKEISKFLQNVAPSNLCYRHRHPYDFCEVAYTHIRGSFVGQTVTLKTIGGRLDMNKDERLFITELDIRPRRRDVYFEIWNEV